MIKSFKENKTDSEKWDWLLKNKNSSLIVNLDNDETFVVDRGTGEFADFSHSIGQSPGVQILLETLGLQVTVI